MRIELLTEHVRGGWQRAAACRKADPDLFFPVSASGPGQDEEARAAKAICAGCAVRRECLQFALATRQMHGIWGGTTEEERSVPHQRLLTGGTDPEYDNSKMRVQRA